MLRGLFWLVLVGACSGRPAQEQPLPAPDAVVDAAPPPDAPVEPRTASFTFADNLHLLGVSNDGTTALVGVPFPLRGGPVFLPYDLEAMRSRPSIVLTRFAQLPTPYILSPKPDFAPMLAALESDRWLDADLAELGAVLRDVPRASMPFSNPLGFAASADGNAVAYTVDSRFGLHVRLPNRPAAFHVPGGDDPWFSPDGRTLLYITTERFTEAVSLWVLPLTDDGPGQARRVPKTGRVLYHLPRVALPDQQARLIATKSSRVCLVDVSLATARTTRWTCEPDTCTVCDPGTYALSPDGAWFAWTRYLEPWKRQRRARLRVMEVATKKVRFDITFVEIFGGMGLPLSVGPGGRTFVGLPDHGLDLDPASSTTRRIPLSFAPRTCAFRDATRVVCLTEERRLVTLDLSTARGTLVP